MSTGDAQGGGNWDFYVVRRGGEGLYSIIHRPDGITDQDREEYAYIFEQAFINRAAATSYVLTENASCGKARAFSPVAPKPDHTVILLVVSLLLFVTASLFVVCLFYIAP